MRKRTTEQRLFFVFSIAEMRYRILCSKNSVHFTETTHKYELFAVASLRWANVLPWNCSIWTVQKHLWSIAIHLSIHFLILFVSIVFHFAAFCTKCFSYAVRAPQIIIKSSIQIMLIQYFTCLLLLETTSNSGWYILPVTIACKRFNRKGCKRVFERQVLHWAVYCCCNFVLFFIFIF